MKTRFLAQKIKSNANDIVMLHKQSPSKFLPLYFLEVLNTFSAGLMVTATANYLLLELQYSPDIGSLISSLYYFGFLVFTLGFGHYSDKFGIPKVLRTLAIIDIYVSIMTLIPIKSLYALGFFACSRFLSGGLNGVFWPSIQKCSTLAACDGENEKQAFLVRYNFSWNIGFIIGMIAGTFIVMFTESNYYSFYFYIGQTVVTLIINLRWVSSSLTSTKSETLASESEKNNTSHILQNIPAILYTFPLIILIFLLGSHSLTDGGIVIIVPLKIKSLGLTSMWVFLLGLVKLLAQTGSTMKASHLMPNRILKAFFLTLPVLGIVWICFILSPDILPLFFLLILSGLMQGATYALGMILMSYKAQHQKSARPFTYFQATMGFGRFGGQILIGFGESLLPFFGVWLLVSYYLLVFLIYLGFIVKVKQLN